MAREKRPETTTLPDLVEGVKACTAMSADLVLVGLRD